MAVIPGRSPNQRRRRSLMQRKGFGTATGFGPAPAGRAPGPAVDKGGGQVPLPAGVQGAPPAAAGAPPLPFWVENQATNRKSGINLGLNDTLGDLEQTQNEALAGYGYNAQFDPAGNLSALSVDPKNPFSRAQLLKRSFDTQQGQTTTGMAAQGKLYSGATQGLLNQNVFGYQRNQDAMQGELSALLRDLIRRRRDAKRGASTASLDVDDWAITQALGGGGQ